MKLTVSKPVTLSDGNVRYRVRLEWDASPKEGPVGEFRKAEMLMAMANTASLRNCGPVPFETCKIFYTGVCWVADMEAISDEPYLFSVATANGE
jgi:hypothetical protein